MAHRGAQHIEVLCVGCGRGILLAEDVGRALVGGPDAEERTFYLDDETAYVGVGFDRPDEPCACGHAYVIVRTKPSLEHWRRT